MSRCRDASVVPREVRRRCRGETTLSVAFAVALGLGLAAAPVLADSLIDVSGRVETLAPRLVVGVTLTNRGPGAVADLLVEGDLLGERSGARLAGPLGPGASGRVSLAFAAAPARPGLHALTLLVEHPVAGPPDAAGNPEVASQRAWLALALGAQPEEAVSLAAATPVLDVRGSLVVRLASRDGEAHRVRLTALTGRGLRADTGPLEVAVPASGEAAVDVPLVRAGAPPGSRQSLLLVAEVLDGPLARTSVVAATVDVRPAAGLLPRVRVPVVVAGALLVAVAVAHELRRQAQA